MLNRKQQPPFQIIQNIDFASPEEFHLNNSIPAYVLSAGEAEVTRVDFVFPFGQWNNQNALIPQFTCSGIFEGSKNYLSAEISEILDFHGAYVNKSVGRHSTVISFYAPNKHLEAVINLSFDILTQPVFPENELQISFDNAYRSFMVSKEKTSHIAGEQLMLALFGENHPYGSILEERHYKELSRDSIHRFYHDFYSFRDVYIVVSGKVPDNCLEVINSTFGTIPLGKSELKDTLEFPIVTDLRKTIHIPKENAEQVSVRAGKMSIDRQHPDFHKLRIACAVLGGYFGSRLMKNIREDKGYTYGIGCDVHAYREASIFWLYAETKAEFYRETLNEIRKEIQILRTDLISGEELQRVKNYHFGEFQRSFAGVFPLADSFIFLKTSKLDTSYYENYLNDLTTITPEQIRAVSKQYLTEDELIFVTCGKEIAHSSN